ncbi:MAG: protein-methionine-sulfoxide reductase catalytic subunit MsrP [Gammaproteobacteria bacterium]|nr:protein-methionine-sulfoxide reductase catalytic subunit MsrP [Gammaproteobacteria bacterium]MDH3467409.1 protein-methionine-sulfoxide reductase catalytic subunit MsrP [Gammaproteobacteria bacterium]
MLIKRQDDIKPSEITNPSLYARRREFLKGGAALALGVALPVGSALGPAYGAAKLSPLTPSRFNTDEELTPYEAITTHNNFYEFGTDKESPAKLADSLRPRPWTVLVDGEVKRPREWDIEDILKQFPLEERIYRLRCVEAWSMVIPWVGISLASFIKAVEPNSNAKYVAFETLVDQEQMPGQRSNLFGFGLNWPYIEGLRIDEATNPLAILGVGLYGEVMPNQNGAPIRLVVPWKYGFKSIKSIVRISFVEQQPVNTWQVQAPREYGFYANVNPQVDHPRWSQGQERRIGDWLKRETLMFNGYGDQVAQLYSGMDLSKNF